MNLHKLVYFLRSANPEDGGGAEQTTEEKAAQLEAQLAAKEAELEAERQKVKNQNSYITKLEADKKNLSAQTVSKPTVTPTPATEGANLSAAERYAINAATNEVIDKSVAELKEKYGEEAFAAFEEDYKQIARANIKDPFNVPTGLLDRAAQMALGSVFSNEEKRVKILGAYVKTNEQPTQTQETTQTEVIVNSPSAQKIGTMQPTDQPGLGPTNPMKPEEGETKKLSPREFFQSMRAKK